MAFISLGSTKPRGGSRHLLIIMTRVEMQKLLDELDHKHVETRDKKIMEESDDELACERENIEKKSSD